MKPEKNKKRALAFRSYTTAKNDETTLIIHPKDKTTAFLERIYEEIPNKTVVTGGVNESELKRLINNHDRIMMMGHGSPHGLFCTPSFSNISTGHVINSTHVELLNRKENSIFIWCNADMFVQFYDLKGFYTGMFISEVVEASYCGLPEISQEMVNESNNTFSNILRKYICEDKKVIHEKVKTEYTVLSERNPVALYNNIRLYVN